MSNMKCPFCNKPLQPTLRLSDEYWCENYDCPRTNIKWVGSQKLWQELIRTKELLDIESSEHELCHDAMVKRTEEVNRTRKALDFAKNAILVAKQTTAQGDVWETLNEALDQITALEQKDVK